MLRALRQAAVLLVLALAGACSTPPAPETLSGQTMGTTWSVRLVRPAGVSLERLRHGIQAEVDQVVAQMSTWEADSDLGRYNRAAPGTWQVLPDGFFFVLRHALALAADTDGAYDPTVGPLVDLWGFGPGGQGPRRPDAAAIEAARARVGWQRLQLDEAGQRLLQPGGVALDLSAIAKGYGTDRIAAFLDASGVHDYLVDISGELRARGHHPDGSPWRVAIEKPGAAVGAVDTMDAVERVVTLRDQSIATSGDYRHFFMEGGKRYSHHIDPRTGWPVAYRIASVTTVARDCMEADATGTAIMVMGPEKGLAWARERGLAVLLILHEGGRLVERMSPAFAALLERP